MRKGRTWDGANRLGASSVLTEWKPGAGMGFAAERALPSSQRSGQNAGEHWSDSGREQMVRALQGRSLYFVVVQGRRWQARTSLGIENGRGRRWCRGEFYRAYAQRDGEDEQRMR